MGDSVRAWADYVRRSVIANAPARGTPAAELTDAQRVAICMALGMDVEIRTETDAGCYRLVFTTPPVAIVDRGDGGYIVATPAGVRLA